MNINIECDMHVYMYNYVGGIQSEWSTIGNSLRVFPQYDPVVVTPMEHPQVSEQPIFDCLPVVEFLNRHLSLIVTLQGVPCIAGLLYVYCVDEWPINCPCQSQ